MVAGVVAAVLAGACGQAEVGPDDREPLPCPSDDFGWLTFAGAPAAVQSAVAVERSDGSISIRLATFAADADLLADPGLGRTVGVELREGEMITLVDMWTENGSPLRPATYVTDPSAPTQASGGLLLPQRADPLGDGAVTISAAEGHRVCGTALFGPFRAEFSAPVVNS